MRRSILKMITTATVIGLASFNVAQADVPLTINGGLGYWFFDHDRPLDDDPTPWVSAEWAFNNHWAAEILYAEDEFDGDNGFDTDVATWQLDMLYYGGEYFGKVPRLRPYVAFGAGEIDFDQGFADSVETVVNVAGGVRWMLTPRFGLRLEARAVHSLDEHDNDVLVSGGVNYYFGDVSTPVAEAPAPLDSDGDGVLDDRDECPGTPAGVRVDSVGCPMAVAQVASMKLKVNFAFDSDRVEERYFSDLSELADFLKRFDDLSVDVEGHTDSVGAEDYNQNLSQRRAQAVVDLLVNEHGIDTNRLNAVGYGESKPVASNDTKDGRAENRRVMATLQVEFEE
jgi:OmpA-OmpF porin, OOP family